MSLCYHPSDIPEHRLRPEAQPGSQVFLNNPFTVIDFRCCSWPPEQGWRLACFPYYFLPSVLRKDHSNTFYIPRGLLST